MYSLEPARLRLTLTKLLITAGGRRGGSCGRGRGQRHTGAPRNSPRGVVSGSVCHTGLGSRQRAVVGAGALRRECPPQGFPMLSAPKQRHRAPGPWRGEPGKGDGEESQRQGRERLPKAASNRRGLLGGHISPGCSPAQDGGCTWWPVTTPPSHTSQREKLLHLMEQQFAVAVPTSTHGGLQPQRGGH